MTSPAFTVRCFGVYLLLLGAVLLVLPNTLLALFHVATTSEVWIRVVGMLVVFLGYYYVRAASAGLSTFFSWTVPVRLSVLAFFGIFVAVGVAPATLLLFAVADAAGALWTWAAIRRSRPVVRQR